MLFIGYHTSSSNAAGVFVHTITGAFTDVSINGVSVTEAAFNAAIAGHFGVPAVMISGDDAVIEEARSILGELEGAVVKHSYSFNAARTLTPKDARALIRDKAQKGVERRAALEPYVVETPVTLDLTLRRHLPAELLSYLPSVERTGPRSVRFVGEDIDCRDEVHGVCRHRALRDRGIALLTDDLDEHPFGPATIELPIKDLLPRAEVELALGDCDHDLAPHHLALVMCVAVIFARPVVMVALRSRRKARATRATACSLREAPARRH